MTRFSATLRVVATGCVLLVGACRDASEPSAPQGAPGILPDAEVLLQRVAQERSPEQRDLSRAIPGFGGVFVAEDGVPAVYLTDEGNGDLAKRGLAGFARARGFDPSQIRVLRAQNDFDDLDRWFKAAAPDALAEAGAVFADLDEANNRLTIGVEHAAAQGAVRAKLARLGIPPSAVAVELTEPIKLAASLQDRVRPIGGGLQINFPGYLCTLGFNTGNSFITNSHCTTTQGGTEGTRYWQPLSSVDNVSIGTEAEDPAYTSGDGCPNGRRCRQSDAARVSYNGGIEVAANTIMRTTRRGKSRGSLEIDGSFSVSGEGAAAVGDELNKVGRTTGWTFGRVTHTCVTTNVSGTNITQLCQNFVQAGVNSGDSGSPVFAVSGNNAILHGILWGGGGGSFVYSPVANIKAELSGF